MRADAACAQVAEPFAFTNSFVGTEEYLSPEVRCIAHAACKSPLTRAPQVINASGHSSPVDWWELGIFLYELMYGFTPFRGAHREQTFENVLHRALVFPEEPAVSTGAQEIVRALLIRDPSRRLGAIGGAEEVKMHAFFADIDFALIRWQTPPFVPSGRDSVSTVPATEDFIFAMDS